MPLPDINEVIKDYPEFTGIHPLANVFPMQTEDQFAALLEDTRTNGVQYRLLRERGTGLLVDGRNRLLAISLTNELFEVEDVEPDRVLARVWGANHLSKKYTASQAAIIAAELRPLFDEEAEKRELRGKSLKTKEGDPVVFLPQGQKARDAAGNFAGVSGTYVDMASDILLVDKALAEEVKAGKTSLRDAHKIVKAQAAAIRRASRLEKRGRKKKTDNAETPPEEQAAIVTLDGRTQTITKPKAPLFNETNEAVSWASWTWNPVTGCEHGCKFCYARAIATSERMSKVYPFGFAPSFHEYRLEAPKNTKWKKTEDPRDGRVFVCSMADLFGKWVPDKWISAVFKACVNSPQWEYLFLTKWPKRYAMLASLPKAWFGASVIKQADVERVQRDMTAFEVHAGITRWISLEPMLEPITFGDLSWCDLVVIGAQTGTSQPDGWVAEFAPKFEWVADVVAQCREQNIPYYLKPNLATGPGMQLTQMQPRRK